MKLREFNVELVRNALKKMEKATKNEISEITKLSVATCGNILRELVSNGEVFEKDFAKSTGGRPSKIFEYNGDFSYIMSMYFKMESDEMELFYQISNLKGDKIEENSSVYSIVSLEIIDDLLKSLLKRYSEIKVLSFGVPGVVKDGFIGICDNKELINVNITEYLSSKHGLEVVVENDVNCTATGYYDKFGLSENDCLSYVYFPSETCPGSGIIINGKIHYGNTHFAGEVGFLPECKTHEKRNSPEENEVFTRYVSKIVASINCVVNPNIIVISGPCFTEEIFEKIKMEVNELTPHGHLPDLKFEKNYHESYVNGLKIQAMDKLACNIKIIES